MLMSKQALITYDMPPQSILLLTSLLLSSSSPSSLYFTHSILVNSFHFQETEVTYETFKSDDDDDEHDADVDAFMDHNEKVTSRYSLKTSNGINDTNGCLLAL